MLLTSFPLLLLLQCFLSSTGAAKPDTEQLSSPHKREKDPDLQPINLPGIIDTHDDQVVFQPTNSLTDNIEGSINAEKSDGMRAGYVPLPVDNPTKSFWIDTPGANPLAEEGSTGELTTDADVCVIGSGITGVSAAWHLARLFGDAARNESDGDDDVVYRRTKRSVVILEARRFCSGATGRNGGHLTPAVFQSFSALKARYNTTEALKSFALEAHTSDEIIRFIEERHLENEVDLVEGGHLTLLRGEVEERAAKRDWEGVESAGQVGEEGRVEWIDNEELSEKYHVDPVLGYSAVHQRGHNLWPCKFVTHLFRDAESLSQTSNLTNNRGSRVSIALHTKTPVTSITKLATAAQKSSKFLRHEELQRRWSLHTPRGTVDCAYVLHATNGYAAHLLPFLSGVEEDAERLVEYGLYDKPGSISADAPGDEEALETQDDDDGLPRGAYGIRPTRGQVGAVRASVGPAALGWLASWDGGNGGDEYWFPRYQDTDTEGGGKKNPLVILGGGRYASEAGAKEVGVWDDAGLNPRVSRAIRAYLPGLFPGKFEQGGGWEMEWSGIMAFTKSGDPFVGPVQNIQTVHDVDGSENPYDGQYISAGYSGHGMPRAYACAEAVAGMIAAQIHGKDWAAPAWLPERYLTWATTP